MSSINFTSNVIFAIFHFIRKQKASTVEMDDTDLRPEVLRKSKTFSRLSQRFLISRDWMQKIVKHVTTSSINQVITIVFKSILKIIFFLE